MSVNQVCLISCLSVCNAKQHAPAGHIYSYTNTALGVIYWGSYIDIFKLQQDVKMKGLQELCKASQEQA